MVHDAARTLVLQHGVAAPAGVDLNAWLVTTVVPVWLIGQLMGRCWGFLWRYGARHRTNSTVSA